MYNGYSVLDDEGKPTTIDPEAGQQITISGILRLKEGLTYGCLSDGLCLTEGLLLDYIDGNMQSAVVQTLKGVEGEESETIASTINNIVGEITLENLLENNFTLSAKYSSSSMTLGDVVRELGGNNVPAGVSVYAKDFNTKDELKSYMDGWNSIVADARADFEKNGANSVYAARDDSGNVIYDDNGNPEYGGPTEINYSDTVGTLMNMVNTILNAITYVLVAFTAISLVVSTVMIGVITYVSVVERTKEIGILRSIGARKRDIRHVFNAETFIIGLCAGLIGIGVAYLLQGLINLILTPLTGIAGLAALPIWQAFVMVAISVALTLISGLIPASAAAKKDPVIALRTE